MSDTSLIVGRMRILAERFKPSDKSFDTALVKIGMMIAARAKVNIRRQGIVDTGRLLNSIRWELYRDQDTAGIYVGSFGVKYAAMNEFGSTGLPGGVISERQRRAMFAALSRRGGPVTRGKQVVTSEGGALRWRARPYLRPALKESRQYIIETIRGLLKGET